MARRRTAVKKATSVAALILILGLISATLVWRGLRPQEVTISGETAIVAENAPQIQPASGGEGEEHVIYGIVRERRSNRGISGATIRAVSSEAEVTDDQSGQEGQYEIEVPEEGEYVLAVEAQGFPFAILNKKVEVHSRVQVDIALARPGQLGPSPGLNNPAGYVFADGVQSESEVRILLAAYGFSEDEISGIVLVELTGGVSVTYRDGHSTGMYEGSFLQESAWQADVGGKPIYVQRKCGNIVEVIIEHEVIVVAVTATPVPLAPTSTPVPTVCPTCPTPVPTSTPIPPSATSVPTATDTPVPGVTPSATPIPSATPTDTPGPTSTPVPTSTPTHTSTPEPTATPTETPVPTDTPTQTPTPTPKPTLKVSCVPEPDFGHGSLEDVDLVAEVSGTATGDITYWFDCVDSGYWNLVVTSPNETYRAENLCDYWEEGYYWARVRVERQGRTVDGVCDVIVDDP